MALICGFLLCSMRHNCNAHQDWRKRLIVHGEENVALSPPTLDAVQRVALEFLQADLCIRFLLVQTKRQIVRPEPGLGNCPLVGREHPSEPLPRAGCEAKPQKTFSNYFYDNLFLQITILASTDIVVLQETVSRVSEDR